MAVFDNSVEQMIKEIEKEFNNMPWYEKLEIYFYRAFRGPIHFFRYDLWIGLKNFWRYKAVIWNHRWWDYSYADNVVEELYKERAENWKYSHHVNGDKEEKELKIIVELFERMNETETFTQNEDKEDILRKEIYQRIARKRYWD